MSVGHRADDDGEHAGGSNAEEQRKERRSYNGRGELHGDHAEAEAEVTDY